MAVQLSPATPGVRFGAATLLATIWASAPVGSNKALPLFWHLPFFWWVANLR